MPRRLLLPCVYAWQENRIADINALFTSGLDLKTIMLIVGIMEQVFYGVGHRHRVGRDDFYPDELDTRSECVNCHCIVADKDAALNLCAQFNQRNYSNIRCVPSRSLIEEYFSDQEMVWELLEVSGNNSFINNPFVYDHWNNKMICTRANTL